MDFLVGPYDNLFNVTSAWGSDNSYSWSQTKKDVGDIQYTDTVGK